MKKDESVLILTIEKLTSKQTTFVEQLLTGSSIKLAAKIAGVTERTAHNWLLLEQVKQAIATGKEALFTSSLSRIELLSLAAIDRLQEMMNDPLVPANVQASCARVLAAKRLEVAPAMAEAAPRSIDWSIFTPAQLDIIQPIFEAAEAERKKQA
jgi:phage terminase small subunit